MDTPFLFRKRQHDTVLTYPSPAELFGNAEQNRRWLFITPYDYDAVAGAGLLIQAASAHDIKIKIIAAGDASLSHSEQKDRDTVSETRRKEAVQSFFSLGVKDVEYLNFPEGNLNYFVGRSEAVEDEDYCVINDYAGLQNAFTYHIRAFRPGQIWTASPNPCSPDYHTVFREVIYSTYNAPLPVWPEAGDPLGYTPNLFEFSVYSTLTAPPQFQLVGNDISRQKKLDALSYYKSQKHLTNLTDIIRNSTPAEYFSEYPLAPQHPSVYESLFKT